MGSRDECLSCAWVLSSGQNIDDSKSNLEWARLVGCTEPSIRRHKKHMVTGASGYRWEAGDTDFEGVSPATDKPLDGNDVEKFILSKGLNPAEWDYTWRFSEWEQYSAKAGLRTLHAFKVSGKRKLVRNDLTVDPAVFKDVLDKFKYVPAKQAGTGGSGILVATDFQLGKTDWNGGSEDTIEQVLTSFHRAAARAVELGLSEVVIVDAGDPIENIYSTSNQLATNDLSLPLQVAQVFHLMLEGIRILSEVVPVRYVAVSSNHGQHRIGQKAAGGHVHDDWGLALAKMIRSATKVPVTIPEMYHESLVFEASGTTLGVVHSHQAGGPDKIGDWWARQSHGNMPTSTARILLAGHWHSFRIYQSGDARWVFVGPASDRGSSWFTNMRGEQSTSGMMFFRTQDNLWSDVAIL